MHKYRRETNYTNLLMEMFIHIVGMYINFLRIYNL